MEERTEAAVLDDVAEIEVAFGADEVLDGDRDCCRRGNGLRMRSICHGQRGKERQTGERTFRLHVVSPFRGYFTRSNVGASHFPFNASSLGQYSRRTARKVPFGAGSQFDSLFLPGDSFWM